MNAAHLGGGKALYRFDVQAQALLTQQEADRRSANQAPAPSSPPVEYGEIRPTVMRLAGRTRSGEERWEPGVRDGQGRLIKSVSIPMTKSQAERVAAEMVAEYLDKGVPA